MFQRLDASGLQTSLSANDTKRALLLEPKTGLKKSFLAEFAPRSLLRISTCGVSHCGLEQSSRSETSLAWKQNATPVKSNFTDRGAGNITVRCKLITKCAASQSAFVASESHGALVEPKVAIVWFKHDLRIDDHLGLTAALQYDRVLPFFIFDPWFYAGWSSELLESLIDAVADLRRSLQRLNSDLVVRIGRTKDVLLALAQEVSATDIISEEEVEYRWHNVLSSIAASLSVESLSGQKTGLKLWRASLYDTKGVDELPENYKHFQRLGCPILPPLDPPTSLPSLPRGVDAGVLPALSKFRKSVDAISGESLWWETLKAAQDKPAWIVLKHEWQQDKFSNLTDLKGLTAWLQKYTLRDRYGYLKKRRKVRERKLEETSGKFVVTGGASGAENILNAYLRFLEPTARDDWKMVHKHIVDMEKRPGASFITIFNSTLALGTLSRRRVLYEARKYERERQEGSVFPFGFPLFTTAAAVSDAKSIEWYEMLQRKSRDQGTDKGFQVQAWRWRGFLIQYTALGEEGPAVVLVHGFGAFWEHYRDNIRGLAEKGNRVWALTMVGFGRSEKPNIAYTELLWAELVRDFIVEVVREPVLLAGNSIGGYTACMVAGLWPSLIKSLVLLNTAGRVVPNYKSLDYKKPRERSAIAKGAAQVLLVYLRNLSNGLLKRCYPNKTSRADDWLLSEVMRPWASHCIRNDYQFRPILIQNNPAQLTISPCLGQKTQWDPLEIWKHLKWKLRGKILDMTQSYDPGSTAVLESIFHMHPPLPLNFYLDRYNGKVLVIQGTRDPLHNSRRRAAMMQTYCSNVSIQYVNAGHCPHDELPDEVNAYIDNWLRSSCPELATGTHDPASTEVFWDGGQDTVATGFINTAICYSDWSSLFNKKS